MNSVTINIYTEGSVNVGITLEEAKAKMTPEALEKLKKVVEPHPTINVERKANCDILMQALCKAVIDEIIHPESLDEKLIKLLNAKTNTLSPSKLGEILAQVRKHQPNLKCLIEIYEPVHDDLLRRWEFIGPEVSFVSMLDEIIRMFNITPTMVRTKMSEKLKPTIVNNIAQTVARFLNSDKDMNISITTVSRLVDMCGYHIYADFKEI